LTLRRQGIHHAGIANGGATQHINLDAGVQYLTGKVPNTDPSNGRYQFLNDNLQVGSSGEQLIYLVNKWFLGVNEPFAYQVDDDGLLPIIDPTTHQRINVAYGVKEETKK
jgi:hypothetical protein